VLVLPCGAGKTVIGLGAICQLQTATLILTTNPTSVRQWIQELLDKTGLDPSLVGEYTGDNKQVKPITVATYQILTYRPASEEEFP
ncbi:helicase, partial [Bacillus sp. SIMBA_074]|uniref:DEAD/DEAH box helicase family protein n=1 Tax=Bacillus sp. SIMBA_074 TaxID=3085812 RepID=UPI0039783227